MKRDFALCRPGHAAVGGVASAKRASRLCGWPRRDGG